MFAFRALITQARIWKRFWVEKLDKFTLFTHFLVGWNLKNLKKHAVSILFCLSWYFKREKSVFWKASFLQNKLRLITRTYKRVLVVYKTLQLVRISLLINALNNRVLLFSSGKLSYKRNRNLFPVRFAYPDLNTRGVWRILDSYANPRILPAPLVFISRYANTENVFYC